MHDACLGHNLYVWVYFAPDASAHGPFAHGIFLHRISFPLPVFSSAPSSVISFKTLGSSPAALYSAMSSQGSVLIRGEKVSSFRDFKPKVSRHDKLGFKYIFDKERDQRIQPQHEMRITRVCIQYVNVRRRAFLHFYSAFRNYLQRWTSRAQLCCQFSKMSFLLIGSVRWLNGNIRAQRMKRRGSMHASSIRLICP